VRDEAIRTSLCGCSIHRWTFDEDGPMLELLKGFHGRRISVPTSRALQPERERLAARFERFTARAA
jgi:hypothetical protein